MNFFIFVFERIDSVLMPFYRFPDDPLLGYFLGTLVLSFASVVIGEYSLSLAFRINRDRIRQDNQEMNHFHELSLGALKAGDKTAFRACNGIANESYGKSFFTQIALSASSLWPVFISLGWMQYRFSDVEFHMPFSVPFLGNTFGYFVTFLFCYISIRLIITKTRRLFYKRSRVVV